ncbi:MAG TPA: Rossmann-like and DUF2520 domain-containing protein [Candidatus Xenobia bacterium]|jgi:predicted short-subunit dehydrogenase-like oxidoreductase (DUF2520 family)
MDRLDFAVVGAGPVGRGLARLLVERGYRVGIASRHTAAEAAEWSGAHAISHPGTARWVFLTPSDDALPAVVQTLSPHLPGRIKVVAHLSGSQPASVLRLPGSTYEVVSMHPVANLPDPTTAARRLATCWFGVEGDAAAVAQARSLIERWGAHTFTLDPAAKVLYHAGACVAAGYLCTLLAAAEDLWRQAGVAPEAVSEVLPELAHGMLESVRLQGPAAALTGPLQRGDADTIRRHLEVLQEQSPQWLDLYRSVGRATLALTTHPELKDLLDA